MSFRAVEWALKQTGISDCARLVLINIAEYANEENRWQIKVETMALRLGKSVRTIQRNLSYLEEIGLLTREPTLREGRPGQGANWLNLHLDRLKSAAKTGVTEMSGPGVTSMAPPGVTAGVTPNTTPPDPKGSYASPPNPPSEQAVPGGVSDELRQATGTVVTDLSKLWPRRVFAAGKVRDALLKLDLEDLRLITSAARSFLARVGGAKIKQTLPEHWISSGAWRKDQPREAQQWSGPPEVRVWCTRRFGEGWVKSYLDPCEVVITSEACHLRPPTSTGYDKLRQLVFELRKMFDRYGLKLILIDPKTYPSLQSAMEAA